MKYFSTRNKSLRVDAEKAVLGSVAPDGGLYMPESIVPFALNSKRNESLSEIAQRFLRPYFGDVLPAAEFEAAIANAFNFPIAFEKLETDLTVLELFHGPSLAFKDFGARTMAELMSRVAAKKSQRLLVLTATSGDTGGAVAAAFQGKENIDVVVLYPRGRISSFQEQQMTGLGGNVKAFAIEGVFDDCQALVKQAFADVDLQKQLSLVSANSINIARLLPQSVYYLATIQELSESSDICFVVPSGNFGNIFAGMFARASSFSGIRFIAALNENRTFKAYLDSGNYLPRASIPTISNAMDVGAPSNLERLQDLVEGDVSRLRAFCDAEVVTEQETVDALKLAYTRWKYVACPHTAVGIAAALRKRGRSANEHRVVLSTAHAIKFSEVISQFTGMQVNTSAGVLASPRESRAEHILANSFEILKEELRSFR